jgi:hypothetical protein
MRLSPILVIASLALALTGSAATDTPARAADGATQVSRADLSFAAFAEDWISRVVARGQQASRAPRARPGSAGLVFTYRAVDPAFRTELRPTGRSASPYVGVLHFTEHTYTCSDVYGSRCTVTSSLPLAEVFRYRDGRWTY